MSSALLPPQGYCAQSSQVCIDIPIDFSCGRSHIIFILVKFLVCFNLERKKGDKIHFIFCSNAGLV